MKNILLASLTGLMVCFSCGEQTIIEPALIEQKIFEISKECDCDTVGLRREDCLIGLKDRFELKAVYGVLKSVSGEKILIPNNPDSIKVDDARFPIWKYFKRAIYACNMPTDLKEIPETNVLRVKFDCKLYYVEPPWEGRSVPQSDGYPVALQRLEILK